MRRCYCERWKKKIEDYGDFFLSLVDKQFHQGPRIRDAKYCLWCGKPLGESKSQQNRLEIQLREKKDA